MLKFQSVKRCSFSNWNQNIIHCSGCVWLRIFLQLLRSKELFPSLLPSKFSITSKSWYDFSFCLLLFMDSSYFVMSSTSPSVKSKMSAESKVCKRQVNSLYHGIILFAETKIFESGFFKSELTAIGSKWWRIILNVRTNDTEGWNLLDGKFLYWKSGHPSGEEMMHFQQQSLKNCLLVGLSGDHWDLGTMLIRVESNCI